MHSPVAPGAVLQLKEIEPGLAAYECPVSQGLWIPLQSYLAWKESNPHHPGSPPAGYAPVPADNSKRPALLCPESGCLLSRYRVGHGLNFHIERSPVTGGVWLDKGEWEALKSRGLDADLSLIFTASYQKQLRTEEHREAVEQSFRDRIGATDFARVLEFKKWLATHPHRRDISCYLNYDAETPGA